MVYKAWLYPTLTLVIGVTASLVVGEGLLRVIGVKPGTPFEQIINHYDAFLGYRMIEGTHEVVKGEGGVYDVDIRSLGFADKAGFRDNGFFDSVAAVFLGDSFVFGYGVPLDSSVSEIIEGAIRRPCVNLGMTAYTSATQYARVLRKYGRALRPIVVFVGIFVGNDYGDCETFQHWSDSGSKLSYPMWVTFQQKNDGQLDVFLQVRSVLYKHSALFKFLSDRINLNLMADHGKNFNEAGNGRNLDLVLYADELWIDKEVPQSQQRSMHLALLQLKQSCVQSGAELVAFVIPTKEMVYQSLLPGLSDKVEDVRYQTLISQLHELDIQNVDLLPVFREEAVAGTQLYFKYDGHWNIRGHALAASMLSNIAIQLIRGQ